MRKSICIIWVIILFTHSISAQKKQLDSSSIKDWKELAFPKISPNGRYLTYCVIDSYTKSSKLILKSTTEEWIKEYRINTGFFNGVLTDSLLIFKGQGDTLKLVSFSGNKEDNFPRVNNFKVLDGNDFHLGILMKDTLLLRRSGINEKFENVLDFHFTDNPDLILLKRKIINGASTVRSLEYVNIKTKNVTILNSAFDIQDIVFNPERDIVSYQIVKEEGGVPSVAISNLRTLKTIQVNIGIEFRLENICGFNKNSEYLIVSAAPKSLAPVPADEKSLTIWKGTDEIVPVAKKDMFAQSKRILFSISVGRSKVVKVTNLRDQLDYLPPYKNWDKVIIVPQTQGDCYYEEQLWNPSCKRTWYAIDIGTGGRQHLQLFDSLNVLNKYTLSPDLRFVVFFDETSRAYLSYSVRGDSLIALTNSYEKKIFAEDPNGFDGYLGYEQRGIAGWDLKRNKVFIYDATDIWMFDLYGVDKPINVSSFFGRKNNSVISFLSEPHPDSDTSGIYTLVALNLKNKDNYFLKLDKLFTKEPVVLSGGPYIYYLPFYASGSYNGMQPLKAHRNSVYLVRRESISEHPNYYITSNFINFRRVSDLNPEKNYNWFRSEIVEWQNDDGRILQGILFKPDVYDSTKVYPVIYNVYQQLSNSKNAYIKPEGVSNSCNVNVPFLISKGFWVFKPDIYYKVDEAGASALSSVLSSVKKLAIIPGVDTSRLGLQGCSWGGFETNYIVTHCNIFKAACSASAPSDLMGFASSKYNSIYTSFYYGQFRLKTMVWQDYKPFVQNSPIFNAANINTPLLIFHTTNDDAVPFSQGAQLFLVLRKLRKPTWLLEYGGSANHGVFDMAQSIDFGVRMGDFFSHYLLSRPAAGWMMPVYK